ncbi:type II secretion system major pseudopilin GspG [Thioalkalivibrio paradoxus]|uniref:Type II secretion system core protein G n=1 Tax=Thioalkalivibrio paradoxus ARh 1 TaxID=713585 RepID=W0DNU7_9GAMM|nr:type II secretion system major pseudopilin GspG [Thioalkalivibrio paradoxus]AHE98555.1 general secretion pathway protein G [Thioalkalivibrio paradoxus ARh 1]
MSTETTLRRRGRRGFTLVELLVVLAILVLLAGLVGPQVLNQLGGAKSKTARIQIEDLVQAVEMFKLDVGRFPSNAEGLPALVVEPAGVQSWNGPYLRRRQVPQDPWGNDYLYRNPGEHGDIDIYSLGADGQPGGSGENAVVGSWQ